MQVVLIGSCQRQAKEGESQRWLSFFFAEMCEKSLQK